MNQVNFNITIVNVGLVESPGWQRGHASDPNQTMSSMLILGIQGDMYYGYTGTEDI
jgi:hypothetical protein